MIKVNNRPVIFISITALFLGIGWLISANRTTLPKTDGSESGQNIYVPTTTNAKIEIAKLNITAPLFLDTPGQNEKYYLKVLENGVAHYKGTPAPGNVGNTFIFGHSEYNKNAPGNYKEVFKHIDQLKSDDTIQIAIDDEQYTYRVIESKIVDEDDMSVLSQSTEDRQELTLMTCWPPGTLQKRFIVKAVLQ